MNAQPIAWSPGVTLEQIEKQVIIKAYQHFRENKTATSSSLGISIRTLDSRLEKYELERVDQEKKYEEWRKKKEDFLMRQRGNPPNNLGIPYQPNDQRRELYSKELSAQGKVVSMLEKKELPQTINKPNQRIVSKKLDPS